MAAQEGSGEGSGERLGDASACLYLNDEDHGRVISRLSWTIEGAVGFIMFRRGCLLLFPYLPTVSTFSLIYLYLPTYPGDI